MRQHTNLSYQLFVLILLLAMPLAGQAQAKEKQFTLGFGEMPLADALMRVEKASGYRITFSYDDVSAYRASCPRQKYTISTAMKQVTQHTTLAYTVKGRFVTLYSSAGKLMTSKIANPDDRYLITGRVVDSQNQPLMGATVFLEEIRYGTSTDQYGQFQMDITNGQYVTVDPSQRLTLAVSFIGLETHKQRLSLKSDNIELGDIMLRDDQNMLENVVVTGYQRLNPRESASAVSSVKAADIMVQGVSSIDQMLQGTMPGLTVINTSGEPSATPKIRIRGNATINGNKSPVWVVDGVILEQDVPFTAADINSEDAEYLIGNAISGINPQDVESITVLKDASATAIYGVKAANGVIVVTTKRGKEGRPVVTYNGDLTLNQRPRYGHFQLMDSQERVRLSKSLVDNGYNYAVVPNGETYEGAYEQLLGKHLTLDAFRDRVDQMQTRNTDWFGLLFRNNVSHTHTINVSGGSDRATYYVSSGYSNIEGSARQSDTERFNALAKFTMDINSHISAMAKVDFSTTRNDGYHSSVNPFNYAYETSRTIPLRNADGTYYLNYPQTGASSVMSNGYNIRKELENTGQRSKMDDFNALLQLNAKLLKGLTYTGTLSLHYANTNSREWATEQSYYISQIRGYDYGLYTSYDEQYWDSPLPYGGMLAQRSIRKTGYTVRNQVDFDRYFADIHHLTLMGGIEARRNAYEGVNTTGYGWTPDFGEKFNPVLTDRYKSEYADKRASDPVNTNTFTQVASFFGVFSYSYDHRYVLNANVRSDGSNKFGSNPDYRWLPTYSFALRWNLMNEHFMKQLTFIDDLALRGSYGVQGNIHEDATPYLIVTTGDRDDVLGLPVSTIVRPPNPDLRWEKTRTWDAAIDFSLWNGALRGGFDVYRKNTSDLIMSRVVAASTGRTQLYYNAGNMVNKGFEGFLNARLLRQGDWEWRMGVNFSRNLNEITYANPEDLSDIEVMEKMLAGTLAVEGAPIGTLYAYEFAGLNQDNGYPLFNTTDGRQVLRGVRSEMKLVDCGSIFPKLTGGFDTQLRYRQLALSMNFTYSLGSVARLPNYYDTGTTLDPTKNYSTDMLQAWIKAGDQTVYPVPYNTQKLYDYLYTEAGRAYDGAASLGSNTVYCNEMYNLSDLRVAKADFLKLKLVSLSYTLPQKLIQRLNVSSLMVRLQVTNLFTLADKKWNGVDPESAGANMPATTTYSIGANIAF